MDRPATTTTTTTARPRRWRHTVGLLVTAVRLVRDAHPHGFALAIATQVAAGLGLALVLLLTRHALDTLLALDRAHGVAPVVPDLVGLLAVLVGSTVVSAARNGLSDLQVEHATRHVRARILDVTGTIDLEEFERPAFYDLLKRAIEYGVPAPYVITMSLLGLVHGLIGIAGVAVALAALQPLLVPIVALACVPRWLASKRNIDEVYDFRFGMTPRERERFYLEDLMTARDPAKEVRAFTLFAYLRARWRALYDERIARLTRMVHRHLRRTLLASAASSLVIAATILALVALTARESIGLGRHQRIADRDAIRETARAAGAGDFLAQLPAGLDTVLGRHFDGSADLSVGQWQRVAIPRALFRDAPFVVLDEPTAALDPRAEQELFASLRTLCAGRAVLLISHRFSTVRSADRIKEAPMKEIDDGKKLALNIETIQTLTPNELDDVAGGADQGNVLRSSVQIICTKIPTCCVRDV